MVALFAKEPRSFTGQALIDEDFLRAEGRDRLRALPLRPGHGAAAGRVRLPVSGRLSASASRPRCRSQRTCERIARRMVRCEVWRIPCARQVASTMGEIAG